MNYQKIAFRRKIVYLLIMVGLLFPLSWLGLPSVSESDRERQASDVGLGELVQQPRVLASMQHQYGLAEANLGEIDPSSATLKLATFGLRGVAANLLWNKADYYKMTENWSKLESVLDQIKHLQPNFVAVWRFQGWNLAYNVSAEWDDYRGRYYWVIKGTNYVNAGQEFNRKDARLVWDEAWFTGHKLGRADEYKQFRKLFHDQVALGRTPGAAEGDESEFPRIAPPRAEDLPPDNWMYAWAIFRDAVDLVTNGGARRYGAGGSDTIFFSEPAKCQIRYVAARVEEGEFSNEIAVYGWRAARTQWEEFAAKEISSNDGSSIRLKDLDEVQLQLDDKIGQLEALCVKTREELRQERLANLTDQERQLLEKPELALRSQDMLSQLHAIQQRVEVTYRDLALNAAPENRGTALKLADEADTLMARMRLIGTRQSVVNYEYWLTRCIVEGGGLPRHMAQLSARFPTKADPPLTPLLSVYFDRERYHTWAAKVLSHMATMQSALQIAPQATAFGGEAAFTSFAKELAKELETPDPPIRLPLNPALEGRKLLHAAHQAYDEDPIKADEPYEEAFRVWHAVFHDYPILEGDGEIYDDLIDEIRRYERVLDHHGERMTEDFILKDLLLMREVYPPIGPFGQNAGAPSSTATPVPPAPMP